MSSPSAPAPNQDRAFFVVNAVVSVGALLLLSWLLLLHRGLDAPGVNLRFLPPLNAVWNSAAAALLVAGRLAIRRGDERRHRALMVAAFVCSTLFLAGYLGYHAVHGDTKFGGVGAVRAVYLAVLASHVLLSVGIVPLALSAFYFAWRRRLDAHRRVTRVLHPVWLYVSTTGVLIYLMLRPYYPA